MLVGLMMKERRISGYNGVNLEDIKD